MNNLLVSFYFDALNFLSGILPNSNGFPLDIQGAIAQIMTTGSQLSFMINFPVTFACLSAVIVFEVGLFVFKMTMWFVRLVRG